MIVHYNIRDFYYKKHSTVSENNYKILKETNQLLTYPNIFLHFFLFFKSFCYLVIGFLIVLITYYFIWPNDLVGVISTILGAGVIYYTCFGGISTFGNWLQYRNKMIVDINFQNEIIKDSKSYEEYISRYQPLVDDLTLYKIPNK